MSRALPAQAADAVIIEQSRREPERFAAIFDRYYPEIHGYAARRLGQGLADDVAAETFLIAFDKRAGYDVSRANARPCSPRSPIAIGTCCSWSPGRS